jgi:NAD(P)-dependent dehydrogenase (short-subunit alcohol dehydrogenase family)
MPHATFILLSGTQALVEHNAKVYIAGRDEKKAQAAMQWLKQETGKDAHFLQLDLSNLKMVKEAAETFLRWAVLRWGEDGAMTSAARRRSSTCSSTTQASCSRPSSSSPRTGMTSRSATANS